MKSSFLLLVFLLPACSLAQPGVCWVGNCGGADSVSSGCAPTGGPPTLQTYIAGMISSQQTMCSSIALSPQPQIAASGEVPWASPSFRSTDADGCYTPTNSCVFSTAAASSASVGLITAYDQSVLAASDQFVDYNYNTLFAAAGPSYAAYCAVTTVCATPAAPNQNKWNLCVDAYNAALCSALANVSTTGWLQHVVSSGVQVRLSTAPLASTFTGCGLTIGSITVTQAENCINPLIQAEITYLVANGVTPYEILAWHEPTGYTPLITGVTFSEAQFTALVNSGCAAVHAATGGSGVRCGGGFTASNPTYISNFTNNATADSQVLGLETYGGGVSSGYAVIMAGLASFCQSWLSTGPAGGTCENTEGNPTVWVPTGDGGSEQFAINGCAWQGWQTHQR